MKPRRIAPKNEQLTEALQGELATYEQQGLYQSSITKRSAYRYHGILVLYQRALGDAPPSLEGSKVSWHISASKVTPRLACDSTAQY